MKFSKEFNEDNYLMISGIQHFAFCRRQWALIHIEQQWEDNYFTIDGELKHERTDTREITEKRGNVISVRTLPVKSHELRITGKCDIVEFIRSKNGVYIPQYKDYFIINPVEYKRGKPKIDNSDIFQLLAQVFCLEEMLATQIEKGYIFYFETRKREEIIFTDELRKELLKIINEMHSYMIRGYTPKVKIGKKCKSCSLQNICVPELNKNKNVDEYIKKRIVE